MYAGANSEKFKHVSFAGSPEHPAFRSRAPAQRPSPAGPGASSSAAEFAFWVLKRAGLCGAAYRPGPLERRVPACLRALRAETLPEGRRRIEEEPQLLGSAVSALLVGVTSFFRDL